MDGIYRQPVIAGKGARVAPYPASRRVYQTKGVSVPATDIFDQLGAFSAAEYGHGWAELESQDCVVAWKVTRTTDSIPRTDYYVTGPASGRECIRIDEYVQIDFQPWYITTSAIDPASGAILVGAADPTVTARWLSDEPSRNEVSALVVPLGAPSTTLGWAPRYSRAAVVSSTIAFQGLPPKITPIGVASRGGGLVTFGVPVEVYDYAALPVAGQSRLIASPPAGGTTMIVEWRRDASLSIPRTSQ